MQKQVGGGLLNGRRKRAGKVFMCQQVRWVGVAMLLNEVRPSGQELPRPAGQVSETLAPLLLITACQAFKPESGLSLKLGVPCVP